MDGIISRVERKKQEARERILAAAERLFIVEGSYAKITIREIAELADVSVGAVYLHFKTKDDILAAVLSTHMARLTGTVYERVAAELTGRGKFEALLQTVSEARHDPAVAVFALIPLMAMSGPVDEAIETIIISQQKDLVRFITEIFRIGAEDGTLRVRGDPAFRAAVFEQTLTIVLGSMIIKSIPIQRADFTGFDENAIFLGFLDLLRDSFLVENA